MFISGTSTRSNDRSTSPVFAGSGLRWCRCARRDLVAGRARALRTPARIAPSLEPQPSTSSQAPGSESTVERRQLIGDARDLGRTQLGHPRVVGAVVGDVAASVGLLQTADPVLEAGRPGDRPRPREPLVAAVRQERRAPILGHRRTPGRSAGRSSSVGNASTAPTRRRGTCRRAGSRACGSGSRSTPPRTRRQSSRRGCSERSPASATRHGGRIAPSAGRTARSSSASRSTARRAGRRRSTIGSSSITASPIVSALRSMPGPLVAVTPRRPPNAAPSAIPAAAISSSAWIVRHPEAGVAARARAAAPTRA